MIDSYELKDYSYVANMIRSKFNKENLQKYINIVANACAMNIAKICEYMNADDETIDEYVDEPISWLS